MVFGQSHSLRWCGIMQNGSTHDEASSSQSENLMVDPRTKWLQSSLGEKKIKMFKVKKLVLSDIKLHF